MLAALRPAGQDLPVLLHIVGATLVFGALLASAGSLALARGQMRLIRVGYFSLLLVALPGWILMRLSGEWIYQKQGWDDLPDPLDSPTWLRIGFGVADYGAVLFVIALVLGGIALHRVRNGKSGTGLLRATLGIATVIALSFVLAVWAMAGKPNSENGTAAAGGSAGASATAVTVTAREFTFELSQTTVPAGKVVFTLVNNGKLPHDFWIGGKATPLVSPGKQATLTVTLRAGELRYVCTVPGHATAGMNGSLTVD